MEKENVTIVKTGPGDDETAVDSQTLNEQAELRQLPLINIDKHFKRWDSDSTGKPSLEEQPCRKKSMSSYLMSVWQWKKHKSIIVGQFGQQPQSSKLALIDMDGTLINSKSKRRIPLGYWDWEFVYPNIPARLKSLSESGYRVIIVTNQMGISLNLVSEESLRKKVESWAGDLEVALTVIMATKKDHFRKPAIGVWDYITCHLNSGEVDLSQCVCLL